MKLKASGVAVLILASLGAGSGAAEAGFPRVVDARGRVVGTVIGVNGGLANILVDTSGPPLAFQVGRDGLLRGPLGFTIFASTDCTGPALLPDLTGLLPPGLNPLASPGGLTPAGTLVVPTAAPSVSTQIQSAWIFNGGRCESQPPQDFPAFATTVVGDLGGLVPPLTIAGDGLGDSGSAGRVPAGTPVAVDGLGQPLGLLAGSGVPVALPFSAWTLLEVGGRPAPVVLNGLQVVLGTALAVYAANDCTGPAFVASGVLPLGFDLFPPVAVAAGGHLLLGTGPAGPLVIGSVYFPLVPGTPCQAVMVAPPLEVLTASEILDLSGRPPPFGMALVDQTGGLGSRRPPGPLTVVDSAGAVLGPGFLGPTFAGEVVVLIRAGRRLGEALVRADHIGGFLPGRFETAGCGGRVLVDAPDPDEPLPLYPPTAMGPGGILHSADGPFDIADLQYRWDVETGTCVEDPRGPSIVQEASFLADLSRVPRPLSVR